MKTTINFWVDGDSGELEGGKRFRLSGTRAPDHGEPGYKAMYRKAKRYAPEGEEVDVIVVAFDVYGRRVVKMRHHGRNINDTLSRWSKEFKK